MQAIETKYLPATNTKPSRIKATCERGSVTIPWNHEGDAEWNHRQAALVLQGRFCQEDATKYGSGTSSNPWARPMVTGGLKNSYVHVFTGQENESALRTALKAIVEQALETYPHFESPRGQANIENAQAALKA